MEGHGHWPEEIRLDVGGQSEERTVGGRARTESCLEFRYKQKLTQGSTSVCEGTRNLHENLGSFLTLTTHTARQNKPAPQSAQPLSVGPTMVCQM